MERYSFTVQVSGIDTERDRYEDRFYEAGCADALIAVVDGTVFLDFEREAPSYTIAVDSAVGDVEKAGGKVIKVTRLDE